MRIRDLVGLVSVLWLASTGPVAADILVSYNDDATVIPPILFGSSSVRSDSLVNLADGSLPLDGASAFTGLEDVDAAHQLADGQVIFSTTTLSYINGTAFQNGDLILYDPVLDAASVFFGESNFSGSANVDAFYLFESGPDLGKFLFSTSASATVGGLSFGLGDIVLYDPAAPAGSESSIFFAQNNFTGTAGQRNVDAVHITESGDLLFSMALDGGKLGP
jgi:hypothetical protein